MPDCIYLSLDLGRTKHTVVEHSTICIILEEIWAAYELFVCYCQSMFKKIVQYFFM